MPFTFSHPAAVLPLVFIKKRWVSVTGLVIGSITPDFEYFLRMQQDSYYSHTLPGVFWFDLPMGLLLVYLFNSLVKREFIEHLPLFLNRRFSRFNVTNRNLYNAKELLFVLISLLIGIMSHLIWDKFTHKSVSLIDQQEHYTVFWEANSIAGAVLIAVAVLKMPLGKKTKKSNILIYWTAVSVISLIIITLQYLSTSGLRELGISAIVGVMAGLIVISIFLKLKK